MAEVGAVFAAHHERLLHMLCYYRRKLKRSSPGKADHLLHISQETMESYAMRTLPEWEAEPLEVHLFSCRECRERLLTLLRTAEKLPQI
jgi:hypothetical protein